MQQALNTLSKDGNQLLNTLLIDPTLSNMMTKRCLSNQTQRKRTIKREEDDNDYHDDASFPSSWSTPPPSQEEMTKRDKDNESSQDEVALDTIDVSVFIYEDYSDEIESDDEAPKFVTSQRETRITRPLLTMTLICFTHPILVPVTKMPMLFQPMQMIMIPVCRRCALPMASMLIC